jgi:hypothetical protein
MGSKGHRQQLQQHLLQLSANAHKGSVPIWLKKGQVGELVSVRALVEPSGIVASVSM